VEKHKVRNPTRRTFLRETSAAGLGLAVASCNVLQRDPSGGRKLRIGVIGAGGRGEADAAGAASEGDEVVAICDVDRKRAAPTLERFPDARVYEDYRAMIAREMLEPEPLDAVTVSTPDHHHYSATLLAMQAGLHVFCQKPLTHTPWEARRLLEAARRYPVATCMGVQGIAHDKLREAAEVVQSGALGGVREVHVWTDRPIWPQGLHHPNDSHPIPSTLNWDLWLGPARMRPFHQSFLPFHWRGWWEYGTGALGDMASHIANLPFFALKLGAPTAVEAESEGGTEASAPLRSRICFEFPPRRNMPAVKLLWYDGGYRPPHEILEGIPLAKNGCYLVGDKGVLYSPNSHGSTYVLLPIDRYAVYQPPRPRYPRAVGHYKEWLDACRGGPRPLASFEYSAPFTEAILLGNVALQAGERIEWDAREGRVSNVDAANAFLRREYRDGWDVS
jgi:predicted dehydrogenase